MQPRPQSIGERLHGVVCQPGSELEARHFLSAPNRAQRAQGTVHLHQLGGGEPLLEAQVMAIGNGAGDPQALAREIALAQEPDGGLGRAGSGPPHIFDDGQNTSHGYVVVELGEHDWLAPGLEEQIGLATPGPIGEPVDLGHEPAGPIEEKSVEASILHELGNLCVSRVHLRSGESREGCRVAHGSDLHPAFRAAGSAFYNALWLEHGARAPVSRWGGVMRTENQGTTIDPEVQRYLDAIPAAKRPLFDRL